MRRKYKLTTFIHKALDNRKQSRPGFVTLLCFLPRLYASYQRPRQWVGLSGPQPVLETFLRMGQPRWRHAAAAFEASNRAEMYIQSCASRTVVHVQIVFYHGSRDIEQSIRFSYDLERDVMLDEHMHLGGPRDRHRENDFS